MSSSWIPAGMSFILDEHFLPGVQNGEKKRCEGKEILHDSIEQDVGLYTGKCAICQQYFVWMRGENMWVLEQDFERQVQLVNERMKATDLE